jgi:hypothetical protein
MPADASLNDLYKALPGDVQGKIKNKIFDYVTSDADTVTVQNPLSPYKGDTIEMTPLQWMATFDENFKKKNPQYAALNAYYSPSQMNRTPGWQVGQQLKSLYKGYGPVINNILDKGPLAGGLLTSAPGLLLGALGTGALNFLTGESTTTNMLRNALIGGLMTGSLGAYSGYLRKYKPEWDEAEKREILSPRDKKRLFETSRREAISKFKKQSSVKTAFTNAGAEERIIQMITNSPGLSFNEKSQLIAGVSQLSNFDSSRLLSSLSGVGGAAIGAIVARFLLNKGLIGTVLGAIFGGALSNAVFGPSIPRTNIGQPSLQGRNILGQLY